jgi:Pentapeptide repeats (8 copies)
MQDDRVAVDALHGIPPSPKRFRSRPWITVLVGFVGQVGIILLFLSYRSTHSPFWWAMVVLGSSAVYITAVLWWNRINGIVLAAIALVLGISLILAAILGGANSGLLRVLFAVRGEERSPSLRVNSAPGGVGGPAPASFDAVVRGLSSDSRVERVAAILSLSKLAEMSPGYRPDIGRVLTRYIEVEAPNRACSSTTPSSVGIDPNRQDIGDALRVLNDFRLLGDQGLDRVDLSGLKLTELNLNAAKISSSMLRNSDLSFSTMIMADFTNYYAGQFACSSAMDNSLLVGVDLTNARFGQVSLRDATITTACLAGADFSTANLDGANLAGSVATQETHWPTGFDPATRGVQVVREKSQWGKSWCG